VGPGATELARRGDAWLAPRPAGILVTGLAGGCAPDAVPGDIVVASEVGPTPSGAWVTPAAGLVERAVAALQTAGLAYRVGRLLTASSLVATAEAKADCWRRHQALAVDMESAGVLAWAARAGVPALAVRAIADGPAEALPPALARLIGPDGVIRPRIALECAARPAVVGAAWRLWRRSRRALDGLGRFLAAFTSLQP
jgi:nucleoside phosphorylase